VHDRESKHGSCPSRGAGAPGDGHLVLHRRNAGPRFPT